MYPGFHADLTPDKPAVIMAGTGRTLTYAELDQRSARLANYFTANGLRPGDHVALLSDNDPSVFEVYWATQRCGLYITPVNSHLAAPEVSYIVNDCGAQALIVAASLARLATDIADEIPAVRIRLAFGGEVPGYDSYDAALAAASAERPVVQPRGSDMLYSSGTTGRPKGIKAPLPDRQVDEPGDVLSLLLQHLYAFDADSTYLSPAPLYHAAPLRFSAGVHVIGGTVVVMERFEPAAALEAIERYRVTHSQWVPTMFIRLLKLDDDIRQRHDLSSLRAAIHAAAPCPVAVKQAMIQWWGPVIFEYYSSTEGVGMTFITSEESLRKPGSVGKPILGQMHICDDAGDDVATGVVGTVYFEREGVGFTYHNDETKTRAAQHPMHPNWVTTGDIGYVDDDGYLFLTDRKAFMIISGGVNIYPQEIEDQLALHPAVHDVAVIGVPDAEMGESVFAVVQAAPGVEPGAALAQQLTTFLRDRIAGFKVPRAFDFVDELPRTPTGKLVKGPLRERYRLVGSAEPYSAL
jgi:long-chain acyl-CoA synthetase